MTAKSIRGLRHHAVQLEPWTGGPSSTLSVTVPRKYLALHPSAVSSPGSGSNGTVPAVAKAKDPPSVGKGRFNTAAARQQQAEGTEEEEGGKGRAGAGGVGVHSPPASSMVVYPAGTTVVVRSVETDPGRTLKFARGETNEAAFQEVLGREVSWVVDGSGRGRRS